MVNNGYSRELAVETVASGKADLVAFGRPFISMPDLVRRLHEDKPLNELRANLLYLPLDKLMQAAGAATTAAPATVEAAPLPRVNPGAAVATPDAPPQSERSAPGDVRTRGNLGSRERGER